MVTHCPLGLYGGLVLSKAQHTVYIAHTCATPHFSPDEENPYKYILAGRELANSCHSE